MTQPALPRGWFSSVRDDFLFPGSADSQGPNLQDLVSSIASEGGACRGWVSTPSRVLMRREGAQMTTAVGTGVSRQRIGVLSPGAPTAPATMGETWTTHPFRSTAPHKLLSSNYSKRQGIRRGGSGATE